MRKLKVLMILHELSRTGAPKVGLDVVQSLASRVEARFVATGAGPLEQRCRSLGPLLLPIAPLPRGRLAWRAESWRRKSAWRELVAWKPDLVYVNSVMSLPLAMRLERDFGPVPAPMLLHVHELDSVVAEIKRSCPDWLTGRPACYVGVSEAVCRRLVEFAGVDERRIVHVPAFVREADFAVPGRSPPAQPGRENLVIVGGAGSPSWRKNTSLWLQTADALRDRADVRFRWVGLPEDPAGESMRVKRRLLGLEDRVELLGLTDQPLQAFSDFDLFLLTSWEDPFPLVVLENMMLGNPVACVPGGGAPDEVGDAGVVVPRFDAREVAAAVRALVDDPQRRRRLGEQARRRVLERFTDRVCVPMLWDAMQQAAGSYR